MMPQPPPRPPLPRHLVAAAVDRTARDLTVRSAVPVIEGKWWGDGLYARHAAELDHLEERFPDDVTMLWYQEPGYETAPGANPEYRFGYLDDYSTAEVHGTGQTRVLLADWADFDRFLAHLPDPNEPGNFDAVRATAAAAGPGYYRIGCWWRLFHERFWAIRGMENMMLDYYDAMPELKRLGEALLGYYRVIVRRFAELGCDAIFSSDDLGHQRGPMMSPEHFRELYLPLYRAFCDEVHAHGMRFILHSCGDNGLLLDDLIAAGVDVFHPVQKGTMDLPAAAQRWGGQISFLVGFDVQHSLIHSSPEAIRELRRCFQRPEGGLLLGMGNGILPGTPIANIEAALEAMYDAD